MSKIQDALKRIQSGKKAASVDGFKDEASAESTVVATLVDRGVGSVSYTVSDKCLHVDRDALREAGLIAPEYHEQLLGNQYQEIKRPLIANAFGRKAAQVEDGNLIMVSSALSGEGKTFTTINLALSMAQELDYSVLLVDADVAKPHASEMFGAAGETGLLDVLENATIPIQSLILPTDVKNLSLLPAGIPRRQATELLASAAMESIVRTLADLGSGQLVVFDSPPLLLTSEAKVLAELVGQIVIVVRAERTSHEAVRAALSSLSDDKAVNLILNQAPDWVSDNLFGYGYGYGNHKPEASHDSRGVLFGE